MASTTDKKIVEIVVKTTGAADIKKLAAELTAMRKEASASRRELQQTNQTLDGFGKTFGTVSKAFGAGLAIKNLVQSSQVVQDLTKNTRELAGEFIDATAEALGFTDALDAEFWMVANQGARDLAHAIGDVFDTMKKGAGDGAVSKVIDFFAGGALHGVAYRAYKKNVQYDVASFEVPGSLTEMLGDLSRATEQLGDKVLQDDLNKAMEDLSTILRNRREYEDRMYQEAKDLRDALAYKPVQYDDSKINLKELGIEAHQSFQLIKIDIDEVGESMLRMAEDSKAFQDNWDEIARTTYSWGDALENAIEYMQELLDLQGDLTNQAIVWGESLATAFKGVLTGELHNTRDLLRSITLDMRNFYAEMASRAAAQQVLKWAQVALGALAGAAAPVAAGSSWTDQAIAAGVSAKGNAFDRGQLIPMALGGIVTRPTLFPMARGMGLMGEAGPEAVMPLKRGSDGKLGVAAGRSNVVIENHGQPVTANVISTEDETRIVLRAATMGANIAQAQMNRSVSSGYGPAAQSLQRAYGLRRRV
jgi:hypothetical protein